MPDPKILEDYPTETLLTELGNRSTTLVVLRIGEDFTPAIGMAGNRMMIAGLLKVAGMQNDDGLRQGFVQKKHPGLHIAADPGDLPNLRG